MQTELHIGMDDTDSRLGGCTTYTASLLFQKLKSRGFEPLDYPWLVRLNPNVPFKTRGNGALSLHFFVDLARVQEVKEIVLSTVRDSVDLTQRRTDPAVVFLLGEVPPVLKQLSERALRDVVSVPESRKVAQGVGIEVHLLKGSRGLVGALASIGASFNNDHTFELIAYRKRENYGTPRKVDHNSIRNMNEKFGRTTFNNVDPETGRVLACPHGPDPVLMGIRGEDPEVLVQAFSEIQIDEEVECRMIFKTNQGTDAHFSSTRTISEIRRYQSVVIEGRVLGKPRIIRGGHVIFSVEDETGSIDCAAYRATGRVRDAAFQLLPGDLVTISGGVRPFKSMLTLNIEKLEVTELVDSERFENSSCSSCGARCESMGKNQGFRCKNCKVRFLKTSLVKKKIQRKLGLGVYLPPPRAHRHLTKPISRYAIYESNSTKAIQANVGTTIESLTRISMAQ